jgi:hypothetical protein
MLANSVAEADWERYGAQMKRRQQKLPMNEQLRKAMEEVSGEALQGSGFEEENSEPELHEKRSRRF